MILYIHPHTLDMNCALISWCEADMRNHFGMICVLEV